MRAVFSSLFKQDLLDAETRYYSISERLGSDLHERVKNAVRSIIRWEGGDTSDHTAFPANIAARFPTTSATRSKVRMDYRLLISIEAAGPIVRAILKGIGRI